jgi:DNA-directed RNA polymerase subunit beta'
MHTDAKQIEDAGIQSVTVRSPMTCVLHYGICQKCYGADVTTWQPIDVGEAVGTIAAQAIGEPGTQLTMNTKHAGGAAAAGGDVVQGLPRVEEVFERRQPKNPATLATVAGTVSEIRDQGREKTIVVLPDVEDKKKNKAVEYTVYYPRLVVVHQGQKLVKGDFLTDGSADLTELFKYAGREKAQEYIISQTSKIYELQGVTISRKHMEVIIRQMFSRRKIKNAGETDLSVGEVVEAWELDKANDRATEAGGELAVAETHLLGIMEVSLTRKSWLSASSFQNTTRILINSAVKGAVDPLRGLKENVIIGRLIPAGTGYKGSKKFEMIADMQEAERRAHFDAIQGDAIAGEKEMEDAGVVIVAASG